MYFQKTSSILDDRTFYTLKFMDRPTRFIVGFFCLLKLGIHLLADYYSGFQGDELLHVETGKHLAFGYMEFPPMIGFLAFLQNLFQSSSVFVHHIFSHLASLGIFLYVSKITWALGGRRIAVFLVLLGLIGIMGRSQQLFQPVVFSQFFWVLSFYHVLKYIQTENKKYAWYLTGSLILGFLTKYDIVFFVVGCMVLFVSKRFRSLFIRDKLYINALIVLIGISPNILWQWQNDFPVFSMFDRLYETQLNSLSAIDVLGGLFISLNPFNYLIIIAGLALPFLNYKHLQTIKYVYISLFISFTVLLLAKGKSYYFYPIFLTLLPFGAWVWENRIIPGRKWLLYVLSALLIVSSFVLVHFNIPLTTKESFIQNEYPYDPKEVEGGKYGLKVERYSQEMWPEVMEELLNVYDSLRNEHSEVPIAIWGKHYSQAGAINLFGEDYGLPESFSLHGSFYSWLPTGEMPEIVLAIRFSDSTGSDFFEPYFETVKSVKSIYNPYADDSSKLFQTIFICKNPKQSFDELKIAFKHRIFE